MMSAMKMSEAIRMKRKKVKEEGLDNTLDTAPGPQMNPQDIHNMKLHAEEEELGDPKHTFDEKSMAPDDPADADLSGTSQELATLKKKMAMIESIFNKLKP